MKTSFFIFFAILFSIHSNAQHLPREFSEDLSNMFRPVITSQDTAVDMYMVALILSSKGKVIKALFSQGTPDSLKSEINHRISIGRIGLTPLEEYWKRFCTKNAISDPTCFIQSVLVRLEDTDSKTYTVDELTSRFTKAATFDDQLNLFKQKLNLIWLAPKTTRILRLKVVD